MKVGGVYKITAPDGRFYIGGSLYVKQRWTHHRGSLRNGKHGSRKLQAVADEFGVDALQFELIACLIDRAHITELEQHFIDALKPELNTFKSAKAAMHVPSVVATAKAGISASERHRKARAINQQKAARGVSREIVRLTDGRVYASSYEAARDNGVSHLDSMATAAKKGWMCGGHYWAWSGSGVTLEHRLMEAQRREQQRKETSSKKMTETTRRPVVRESDGRVFYSLSEAARQCGVNHNAIHRALKQGTNSAGSRWSYAEH